MPDSNALTNAKVERVTIDNFPDKNYDLIATYNTDALVQALG